MTTGAPTTMNGKSKTTRPTAAPTRSTDATQPAATTVGWSVEMTRGLSEGLVCGADLSFTRSAIVWLNRDYTIADKWASPIQMGPRELWTAFKIYSRTLGTLKPTLMVIEDNCGTRNMRLVRLNSVFMAACQAHRIKHVQYNPGHIRKEVFGKGNADKEFVAQELARLYGIKFEADKGYDWSDAAACAVYGLKGGK